MPTKLQVYSQMADHSAEWVTQGRERWTSFLDTAARLYKYPFPEQLMIFAQRPDARACATLETWNDPMNRWIKRGAKGIALIDTTGDKPRLKYVFDVSDTEDGRRNPRRPYLWELNPEHEAPVMEALARAYDSDAQGDLGNILYEIAGRLATEYYDDNRRDIEYSAEGSYLEDFDEFNIGVAYRDALTVSLAYTLMSRCGVDPGEYLEDEDFMPVFDFNTPDAVNALGTGVSQLSEQVLREIEVTIKNYERQKAAERSVSHGQLDIPPTRGLSDTQPHIDGAAGRGTVREIRPHAPDVPERSPANIIQFPDTEREAAPAPDRDRPNSEQAAGATYDGADGAEPAPGQGSRSNGVGTAYEQPESTSGRIDIDGADLQLEPFPTEQAQREAIAQAEDLEASAFSISDEEIDALLRQAVENPESRQRIWRSSACPIPRCGAVRSRRRWQPQFAADRPLSPQTAFSFLPCCSGLRQRCFSLACRPCRLDSLGSCPF